MEHELRCSSVVVKSDFRKSRLITLSNKVNICQIHQQEIAVKASSIRKIVKKEKPEIISRFDMNSSEFKYKIQG